MKRKGLFGLLVGAVSVSATLPLTVPSNAGDHFFFHRQRTKAKCYLEHDYSDSRWPFTEQRYFRKTVIAVAATDSTSEGRTRKPFHFRATAIELDQLRLDQVGIMLMPSGRLYATGRITHDGGDGGLIGNNIIVRVRAYVSPNGLTVTGGRTVGADGERVLISTPNEVTRIPPDSYRVWESKHETWVPRGGPHHIKLAPEADKLEARRVLADQFDDITHLEVELAYQRDR